MKKSAQGSSSTARRDEERRQFPRYPAVRPGAWIGWEGPAGFAPVRASIRDISTGGSALDVEGEIPAGKPVWIKPADVERVEWARALVVRVVAGEGAARSRVHLKFADGCPYDLFRAAVVGIPVVAATAAALRGDAQVAPPAAAPVDEPSPRPLDAVAALRGTFAVAGESAATGGLRATFSRSRGFGLGA